MTTATEEIMKQREEELDARMLHDAMDKFTRDWQPADRVEAGRFQADLLRLVQLIHRDAARPYHDLMVRQLQAMPMSPFIAQGKEPK